MFEFDRPDLFSLHALVAGIGWAIASGMAILHMHIAEQHRLRSFALIVICFLGFVATLIEGAHEHKQARVADERQQGFADGLDKIQKALSTPNTNPDQILAAAAAKIMQQQGEIDKLKKLEDRKFNEQTRSDLVAALRRIGLHTSRILFVPTDWEAESFARSLASVFQEFGWNVLPVMPSTLDLTGAPSQIGILFFCNCSSIRADPTSGSRRYWRLEKGRYSGLATFWSDF